MPQADETKPAWVQEFAPAKINLALHVTGQMDNGYHQLHSLVVFTSIGDIVRLRVADKDEVQQDSITFSGPFGPLLENDGSNLVLDALHQFRQAFDGQLTHGVHVELEKNLPVAAGIGGGSADAAAMLRLLCRVSDEPVPREMVMQIAQNIGADVPVCMMAQAAEMSGVGERLRLLSDLPQMHLVLANPKKPLITGQVFRALTQKQNPAMPVLPFLFKNRADFALWLKEARNDLQAPAEQIMPEVRHLTALMADQTSCVLARMSGSGATVFGLFGSAREAQSAAAQIRQQAPNIWCAACETL